MLTIFVVDDDIEIHKQIEIALSGYRLVFASTVAEALKLLKTEKPELIILDVSLPDGNGLSLLIELQGLQSGKDAPIIFLSSKDQSADKVAGLSLGADDYITKPFDRAELRARVQLRIDKTKSRKVLKKQINVYDLEFDIPKQQLFLLHVGTKEQIFLTSVEFKLLIYFAEQEGRVLSREILLNSIWGNSLNVVDRTIDAHISNLRKKISKSKCTIRSVYGEGYKFSLKALETKKNAS